MGFADCIVWFLSVALGGVLGRVVWDWYTADRRRRDQEIEVLWNEWNSADDKYRALNAAADDMAWAVREFEVAAPVPLPPLWMEDTLKAEEVKAWKEYEGQGDKVIKNDRHLRLSNARRTLQAWEKESGCSLQLDDIRARVAGVKEDERIHVAASITAAQLSLEGVKRSLGKHPDWKRAGDQFTPIYMVGLAFVKHSIFSKVKEFACDEKGYIPKAFAEFKEENPVNMTEQDAKDFMK